MCPSVLANPLRLGRGNALTTTPTFVLRTRKRDTTSLSFVTYRQSLIFSFSKCCRYRSISRPGGPVQTLFNVCSGVKFFLFFSLCTRGRGFQVVASSLNDSGYDGWSVLQSSGCIGSHKQRLATLGWINRYACKLPASAVGFSKQVSFLLLSTRLEFFRRRVNVKRISDTSFASGSHIHQSCIFLQLKTDQALCTTVDYWGFLCQPGSQHSRLNNFRSPCLRLA